MPQSLAIFHHTLQGPVSKVMGVSRSFVLFVFPQARSSKSEPHPVQRQIHPKIIYVILFSVDLRECEPLGDLLSISKPLPELSARELCNLQALALSYGLGSIATLVAMFFTNVHHVLILGDSHVQLWGMLLTHLLCIEGSVEVLQICICVYIHICIYIYMCC